jgi:hypothetical protein
MFSQTTEERMNKDVRLDTFKVCLKDYVLENYNELDDDEAILEYLQDNVE